MIKLYSYFRSSAAYRVRIALNYKQLDYEVIPVHLLKNNGEQHSSDYQSLNPQELVPTLSVDEQVYTQSLAIIEWLEETHPKPALLPTLHAARAQVRALAQIVACDMHPLNNLRVLNYLKQHFQCAKEDTQTWYTHWLRLGFDAIESQLQKFSAQDYCYGKSVSMADVCLIPQIYNAKRFDFDMSAYPHITRVYEHCLSLDAFAKAQPEQQIDAE